MVGQEVEPAAVAAPAVAPVVAPAVAPVRAAPRRDLEAQRVRVPADELAELASAVHRMELLDLDPRRGSVLVDPCFMLDALTDVYAASRRLVHHDPRP